MWCIFVGIENVATCNTREEAAAKVAALTQTGVEAYYLALGGEA